MSGLSAQQIGTTTPTTSSTLVGTHYNVYHVMVPYSFNDNRISISPVYIYNVLQTNLWLSKTTVKVGDYVYPRSATNGKLFYIDEKKIKQNNDVLPYSTYLAIGSNYFKLTPTTTPSYLIVEDNMIVPKNLGLNINRYVDIDDFASGITLSSFNNTNVSATVGGDIKDLSNNVTQLTISALSSHPKVQGSLIDNSGEYCLSIPNNGIGSVPALKSSVIFIPNGSGYFTGLIWNDSPSNF